MDQRAVGMLAKIALVRPPIPSHVGLWSARRSWDQAHRQRRTSCGHDIEFRRKSGRKLLGGALGHGVKRFWASQALWTLQVQIPSMGRFQLRLLTSTLFN